MESNISFSIKKEVGEDLVDIKLKSLYWKDVCSLINYNNIYINNNTKTIMTTEIKKIVSEIHDLLRTVNISNSNKSLFIIGILLSFQDKDFYYSTLNHETLSSCVISSIKKVIKNYEKNITENDFDKIIKSYTFIKTHTGLKNTDILYKIIEKIDNFIIKPCYHNNIDIINIFYSEFVKYGNTDSKSLGIVLTPEYTVSLMIKLAEITIYDIVLDPCAGTGSFLLESMKYSPLKIIGCEYQNDLFNLLKCNMILRKINCDKAFLIKDDCFNQKFSATKSISNPPFGLKFIENSRKDLSFIIKQIDSVSDTVVSIFPVSWISSCSKNNKQKQTILDKSSVKCIINLNKDLFKNGNVSVGCCILVLDVKKKHDTSKDRVLMIDYSNDGLEVRKHKGREIVSDEIYNNLYNKVIDIYKNPRKTNISLLTTINVNDDWNYTAFANDIDFKICSKELQLKMLNFEYVSKRNEIIEDKNNYNLLDNSSVKKFLITEIFDIETDKKPLKLEVVKKYNGNIPFIGASENNNGITHLTKLFEDKDLIQGKCITVAKNGSVCSSFFQRNNFYCSGDICILRMKEKYSKYKNNLIVNLYICNLIEKCKKYYNYSRKFNISNISKQTIELPINQDNSINFEIIQNLNIK